ncbi:MAG: hypothetical protein AAGA30_00140 [Planctomycetota bacterium]
MYEFDGIDEGADQAFAMVGPDEDAAQPTATLLQSKTIKERVVFWLSNLLILPIVVISYVTIASDGLRRMLGGLAIRLHKLALPGAEYLESYSGFDRLDTATLASFALFVAVGILWVRIFRELQDVGELKLQRSRNPVRFFLLAIIAGTIILADSLIFYIGLSIQASSGWNDTPEWVPIAFTVLFMCSISALGAWHCDYHYSRRL